MKVEKDAFKENKNSEFPQEIWKFDFMIQEGMAWILDLRKTTFLQVEKSQVRMELIDLID